MGPIKSKSRESRQRSVRERAARESPYEGVLTLSRDFTVDDLVDIVLLLAPDDALARGAVALLCGRLGEFEHGVVPFCERAGHLALDFPLVPVVVAESGTR